MSVMSSSQRQEHLEMLGVTQWYARSKLDGALPTPDHLLAVIEERTGDGVLEADVSPGFDHKNLLGALKSQSALSSQSLSDHEPSAKKESSADQEPSTIQEGSANQRSSASQDPSAFNEVLAGKAPSQNQNSLARDNDLVDYEQVAGSDKREVANASEGVSLSAVQEFSVHCFMAPGVIVISEGAGMARLNHELVLVKNIFRAVTELKENSDLLEFSQSFHWPVFHSLNLQAKQDAELNGIFSSWLNDMANGAPKVMYFGRSYSQVSQAVNAMTSSSGCIQFAYSLQEMLQIPLRKREVWHELLRAFP